MSELWLYRNKDRSYRSCSPSHTPRSYIRRCNLPDEEHSRPSLCAQGFPAMHQEECHHKVRRLSYIGIEETERIVTARVNSEADFSELILGSRRGLGATKWTFEVGVTDIELIVICCIGFQFAGFDLYNILRSENWMSLAFHVCIVQIHTFRV